MPLRKDMEVGRGVRVLQGAGAGGKITLYNRYWVKGKHS